MRSFEDSFTYNEESFPAAETTDLEKMLSKVKISRQRQTLHYPLDPLQDDVDLLAPGPEIKIEDNTEEMPQFLVYRDFIFENPAYEWLVACLRREFYLAPAEPNSMEVIREKILSCLLSTKTTHSISRKRSPEPYKVTFEVEWDPVAFVKEQEYTGEPGRAIEMAITLTGSAEDAQALTCVQYLRQTWPSTGGHIMQLIKDVVRDRLSHRHRCKFLKSKASV